jgi:hypothetical protein
MWKAR